MGNILPEPELFKKVAPYNMPDVIMLPQELFASLILGGKLGWGSSSTFQGKPRIKNVQGQCPKSAPTTYRPTVLNNCLRSHLLWEYPTLKWVWIHFLFVFINIWNVAQYINHVVQELMTGKGPPSKNGLQTSWWASWFHNN